MDRVRRTAARRGPGPGPRGFRLSLLDGVPHAPGPEADCLLQEDGGAGASPDSDAGSPGHKELESLVHKSSSGFLLLHRGHLGRISGSSTWAIMLSSGTMVLFCSIRSLEFVR